MKKCILLFYLLGISLLSFSQTTAEVGGLYKFISPMKLMPCDEDGVTKSPSLPVATNWQFTVQKIVSAGIVISFSKWNVPKETQNAIKVDVAKTAKAVINAKLNKKYHSEDSVSLKYFFITDSALKNSAVRLQHGGTVSLVTGTNFIKFRPGSATPVVANGVNYYKNTDISNDFTLSILASVKLSPAGSNSDFFGLFGVNFSSIKVTPSTTQGFLTSETNIGSIAPTIGIVYQIDKVQIGVLSGIDVLTGDVNRYWVYRGRPWFAIGIGFSLIGAYGTATGNSNK